MLWFLLHDVFKDADVWSPCVLTVVLAFWWWWLLFVLWCLSLVMVFDAIYNLWWQNVVCLLHDDGFTEFSVGDVMLVSLPFSGLRITHVRVPKTGKTGIPPTIIFFLCKIPVKRAVARLSFRSGTIVRVRLKFVLNYHWNQYFYYANFASAINFYGNFMVTLTMVPDRFESRATAHLIAFKQSEMMMVGGKPVLANLSTLTWAGVE